MIYKVKYTMGGMENTERMEANSEQEARSQYAIGGLEVISVELEDGQPSQPQQRETNGGVGSGEVDPFNAPNNFTPQQRTYHQPPAKPKFNTFMANGVKFRMDVTTGEMEMFDWEDVESLSDDIQFNYNDSDDITSAGWEDLNTMIKDRVVKVRRKTWQPVVNCDEEVEGE